MSAGFNAAEVFEVAVQIERYGARFYRTAAEMVEDDDARHLLIDLAEYEDQHEETFRDMKAQLIAASEADPLTDLDDTVGKYLQAMANGVVFDVDGEPGARLRGDESVSELLRLALQMEQSSIAFYTGIRQAMPASWGPEKVETIIREEMSHVVYISNELARRHGAEV